MKIEVFVLLAILGAIVFYISDFFIRKFIVNKSKQSLVAWIITIIALPLMYIYWISCIAYYPTNSFDKNKWRNETEKRYELSDDIIKSKMLIGKTGEEVKQILGFADYMENGDFAMYYLGFRPYVFAFDPAVLNVEFKDGRVISVSEVVAPD